MDCRVVPSATLLAKTYDSSLRAERGNPRCIIKYMSDIQPCIYILASKYNGTLYVGVTSNLSARVDNHKRNAVPGFTEKYKIHTLVYAESYETMTEAIRREKQLKAGSRAKKIILIEKENPNWIDISDRL